jgi:predicted nucleic acid-binding Zn ribbon protein
MSWPARCAVFDEPADDLADDADSIRTPNRAQQDRRRLRPQSGVDAAKAALASARAAARKAGSGLASKQARARKATGDTARSGAGPDDRDPQRLATAIERLIRQHGWEVPAAVGGVLGRWDEIVGADVAAHCQPVSYTDGVLTVVADSTAWATQVRLLAGTLLRRLNQEVGHGTVTKVIVHGPGRRSWAKGPLAARDGRGPRDTYG